MLTGVSKPLAMGCSCKGMMVLKDMAGLAISVLLFFSLELFID